jgi:uncharacterized protein YbjT (DUF2867 family)
MKAFVAGATGETGRRIVKELVERNIPVRAMVRNLEKAKEILPAEAELVVGDVLKPESLAAAIGDSTVLLCATGASPSLDPTGPYKVDYEGTKNLVDVAKTKGIEHFVMVSSLCVSQSLLGIWMLGDLLRLAPPTPSEKADAPYVATASLTLLFEQPEDYST